jgi:hypothetical protein
MTFCVEKPTLNSAIVSLLRTLGVDGVDLWENSDERPQSQ